MASPEQLEEEWQPGDDEHITRREHRRAIALFVNRLQRIEEFCFEDEKDSSGRVTRPSLYTLTGTVDRHIKTMCDWARMVKWAMAAGTVIGGFLLTIHQLGIF